MTGDVKSHRCISTIRILTTSIWKSHPLIKIINSLTDLPAQSNISVWWNSGFSFRRLFSPTRFNRPLPSYTLNIRHYNHLFISNSCLPRCKQWISFSIHANGVSIFICLFIYLGWGMYSGSYTFSETWNIRIILLFTVIATAVIGYILRQGQIPFWGGMAIKTFYQLCATWLLA